jgi:hypothetical protein
MTKEALFMFFLTRWWILNLLNDIKEVSVAEKKAEINNKIIRRNHSQNATNPIHLLKKVIPHSFYLFHNYETSI